MNDARTKMLDRIRTAIGRSGNPDPTIIASEAEKLLSQSRKTQPALKAQDFISEFIAKVTSERLSATVELIASEKEIPSAIQKYLEAQNAALQLAITPDPTLQSLDWGKIETHEALDPNQGSAVSRARWGIAETGSLVLTSSPTQPTLYAFLPLRHIVILPKSNVVGHMEDFWRAFRDTNELMPRNINFVTGVSGTADIESKLVRGAHGPRQLHILLVG
jgi:L-lactate dehydrogenase complex protein LldG